MARVFVGNLPPGVRERDLTERFERYGRISSVRIKFPARPPPFAFLEFEDERDASDAVRAMHGRDVGGSRLRVEISHGGSGATEDKRPRGTMYRVTISGLPPSMSWQDLKDFLRDGGDVVHSDVDRRGHGTASFITQAEMERAIDKLDGRELQGERVSIQKEGASARRSSSPSPARSPRRSSRRRSRSRSRSRSPRRSRSRSPRRSSRSRRSRSRSR